MTIKPNMVIVKLNDSLVAFPLDDNGIISNGTAFESDYILEDYNIVFALYNEDQLSSQELYRFSYLKEEKEEPIIGLYEQGQLQEFVKYIFNNELGVE